MLYKGHFRFAFSLTLAKHDYRSLVSKKVDLQLMLYFFEFISLETKRELNIQNLEN